MSCNRWSDSKRMHADVSVFEKAARCVNKMNYFEILNVVNLTQMHY